ncbi:gibberellin-regulated protein 12-like [Macadamia integrifolia]|uniref:gibberellin-regulated protein 12-like n=1 Tax=Macadamia integrifolia TaxID=60698 RepID=UPI001C4F13DC|nr:gibberellin-regulated protein 12-like [Macadamia integrifolia]
MARFSLLTSAFLIVCAMSVLVATASVQLTTKTDDTYHPTGGEGSLTPQECPKACDYRCSATSHKEPCLFFCNMCCNKCLCVPSGTYGNKEECPCYNNWTTQEGKPKCP